ncbi:uro-adherence factor A-like, partial [Centroberyx affinis]|uniref:uro-adherence factor A-like n=1 Tax=Centroberyx affinis TaxID=166261 RepID=UPI003A5BA674
MKLNPQQAPLYGECVLTVHLEDDEARRAEGEEEEEEEVEFYLLFSGSSQRHLTSTLRVSHVTLQAMCPAHDVCEQVLVTLCSARPGGPVDPHSQESFCFVQDLALDMAHFLLNNTTPQDALLLDDQQVPLKECERLDQSLALALKHLTPPCRRTAPGAPSEPRTHTHTDAHITHTLSETDAHLKAHMDTHTDKQAVAQTDTANTHAGIDGRHIEQIETHLDIWMDGSAQLENGTDLSQCQQRSSLLHLAASRGLSRVASFLLQQPGGREALRLTDARGQTPACLAKTKGHQQVSELFTEYETSSPDLRAEPVDRPHLYPGGRAFQHHPSLGTYTLTLPGHQESVGGGETESSRSRCLQEEVKELRGLIQLHRSKKGNSDFAACWAWPCSNGQPESEDAAGPAAAAVENRGKAAEERGSPPSLEDRRQGEDSAVVSHTSCTRGSLCHGQEAGGEPEGTPAANWHSVRNRKNKKRTAKARAHATKTPGNNKTAAEAVEGTARKPAKTTGSRPGTEGTPSPVKPASTFGEGGSARHPSSPGREGTPLPIKPLSGPGGEGKRAGSGTVASVTTTVEKQEGANREVDLETCDREVERETLTETKQRYSDLASGSLTEKTATMGQEQSQDPQDSLPCPGEPGQPDSRDQSPQLGHRGSPKSPGLEGKPQRGWLGTGIGLAPHGSEIVPNTVWYRDEKADQSPNEGARIDSGVKEQVSQTVWYDYDTADETKNGQLEQGMREHKERVLSSPPASGLSPPQLLEQGLSFCQLSSALSQPHSVGIQPLPSRGPGAQRREVHRSQQEEEVGEGWKEGAVEGGGEEFVNREKSNRGESGERAEAEEREDERRGSEEKGEKGRKKRRKKRGKRGGAEVKLSSSSSTESQNQIETQPQRETVAERNTQSETERQSDTQGEAEAETGRADVQAPSASEPVWGKEADGGTMRLPSQTEGEGRDSHGTGRDVTSPNSGDTAPELSQTDLGRTEIPELTALQPLETKELSEDISMDSHGPDGDLTNLDSSGIASELSQTDIRETEITEVTALQLLETKELSDPTELVESEGLVQPVHLGTTVDNMESTELLENEDFTVAVEAIASVDLTGLVESNDLKELSKGKEPLKHLDPTKSTEDSGVLEFPEQNAQLVESMDSTNPVQPMDCLESMGSVQPAEATGLTDLLEASSLLFEGTADVSPLQIQEGSAETTAREYLEHCLASEFLGEQRAEERSGEEKQKESREGEEEKGDAKKTEERQYRHSEEPVAANPESWERGSGEKEGEEEIGSGEKREKHIEKEERRGVLRRSEEDGCEEFPLADAEEGQSYTEELAATAVAVVTVAIASAIANIELSQRLANTQSTSKEQEQDTEVPTETVNQLTEDSYTQKSTLIREHHANRELLVESHRVTTELDTEVPAETENPPAEHSHIESKQFTSKESSIESDAVVDKPPSERENRHTAQPSSKEQANLDLSDAICMTQLREEGIQLARANTEPLPEADDIVATQVDGQGRTQTEIQPCQDSRLPCPVIDTGQRPAASDVPRSRSKENPGLGERTGPGFFSEGRPVCEEESETGEGDGHPVDSYFREIETDDNHSSVSVTGAPGEEVGGQTCAQDVLDSECKAEGRESGEEGVTDVPNSDSQATESKGDPHPDGRVERAHADPSVPSVPPLYGTPRDSPPTARSNLGSRSLESSGSRPSPEMTLRRPVVVNPVPTDNEGGSSRGPEGDSNAPDTVDGWRERESKRPIGGEDARRETITPQDRSHTEPETFPAAREQPRQPKTDSDSTDTLEIQRERDTFYPLQPCPEANTTVTPCTALHPAIHPEREEEECVSVCVLQRDTVVGHGLDDAVFKK